MNARVAVFRGEVADLGVQLVRAAFPFLDSSDELDVVVRVEKNRALCESLMTKNAYIFKVRYDSPRLHTACTKLSNLTESIEARRSP
jgi:hypothetical protein